MLRCLKIAALFIVAASVMAEEAAGPVFTPYGMAQYRLRLRLKSITPEIGDATSSTNYRNMIAYYIGTNVKVNNVVSFGFQIGDDAITTEEVSFLQQKTTPTWISQAWAKVNPGFMNLTFGVLPVKGNGTLDLIERSLTAGSTGYEAQGFGASQVSWPVGTNASLEGIKLGVPVCKEAFKMDVELTQAILTNRTQSEAKDPKSNGPAVMFILNLPMSLSNLKLTPEIVAILNRDVNPITEESDMELAFGFAGEYKINDKIGVTACGAMAMHNNSNTFTTPDSILHLTTPTPHDSIIKRSVAEFDYTGIMGGVGGYAKIGPGKLELDFKVSTNENTKIANSKATFLFADIKYGFCMLEQARKNITIMPRVRFFPSSWNNYSKLETRPELMFIGKF